MFKNELLYFRYCLSIKKSKLYFQLFKLNLLLYIVLISLGIYYNVLLSIHLLIRNKTSKKIKK